MLIAASFGLMLLGKADALLAERLRMALADGLAPIYAVLSEPLHRVRSAIDDLHALVDAARGERAGCARRTSGCGAGSRSRSRWMPRTSG